MCSARKYFEAVVIHEARAPAILLLFAGKLQLFDGHGGRCGSTNDTRAFDSAEIPVARNCFANEGQVVRKPNSGSARHRWARENSKQRRTATRQRGLWRSLLKQIPLDLIQPVIALENGLLKIVRKAVSLRAPGQSTELPKFRVYSEFCQRRGLAQRRIQPAKRVRRGHPNIARRDDQQRQLLNIRQRVNLVSSSRSQRPSAK